MQDRELPTIGVLGSRLVALFCEGRTQVLASVEPGAPPEVCRPHNLALTPWDARYPATLEVPRARDTRESVDSDEDSGASLSWRGGTLGECHLETATRSRSALAALAHGHARQLGDQCLDHAARLGVVRSHRGQWATVPPDE
jgi:hypothetical protein